MTHYRIYLLGSDERIRSGRDATCDDDAEALAMARALASPGQPAEVWTGTRSLGRVVQSDASENAPTLANFG